MPPFDYPNPGMPRHGSLDWGAARILQMMEDEEHQQRMAWADVARHSSGRGGSTRGPTDRFEATSSTLLPPIDRGEAGPLDGRRDPEEAEPFLTARDVVDVGISFLPVVGDFYGLYRDIDTYIDDPESRTWTNFGLTAAGMLPFFPGGMTKIIRKGGQKLEDILAANPRAKIEDIPADATGRLGRPITRETVIRVADHLEKQLNRTEPGRFALIAGGGRRERAIAPVGHDGYEAKRLSEGSRFGDIMFLDTKTGRQIIVQIARVDANGRPIAAELDAALQIARTPTRIPGPYREVDDLMKLDPHRGHTVLVVTPPASW